MSAEEKWKVVPEDRGSSFVRGDDEQFWVIAADDGRAGMPDELARLLNEREKYRAALESIERECWCRDCGAGRIAEEALK